MSSPTSYPRDFLCEHTSTKSRVLAVLPSPSGANTLKAVLTCTDPVLAQRAASILSTVALTGGGPTVNADAESIAESLPAAPAASFREAYRHIQDRDWPTVVSSTASWHAVQSEDNPDHIPSFQDEKERTPSDAKLNQLPGKVFRLIQFLEYHVHDVNRLLTAAAAEGWSPVSDEQDSGQWDDLLDALMHMADIRHEVPGADIISQESSGEPLVAAEGAELAGWQHEPVIVEFGGGWRLRAGDDEHEPALPDFGTLFPVRTCDQDHEDDDEALIGCEICGSWQLTPRTADMLHTALENLCDEAHNDVDERGDAEVSAKNKGDWWFFDRLPRITWRMGGHWRRQIAHACEDLARDLEAGQWPRPRSTAEEMVLHLAIEDAPDYLEMAEDTGDSTHDALPKHADDYDWHMCSEILFEDHDVLMLFDPGLDGLEDPNSDVNERAAMGDLRAAAWPKFFSHLEPRAPSRTFHR